VGGLLANQDHLRRLRQGVEPWNAWRREHPKIPLDLSGANLREAELAQALLSGANLSETDLSGSNLIGAKLRQANLSRANLSKAHINFADFWGADLQEADLHESHLFGANLGEANLGSAVLVGAELMEVSFVDANLDATDFQDTDLSGAIFSNDLRRAKNLERVEAWGPSRISIDTLYRSDGQIPLAFLRATGVPENLITFLPSLVAPGAIQFYSCFISYSTKDQEFADRLHADLQNKGVRCWFAPHDVQGGKKLHEQIDEAIRRYERLLLILSPNSMNSKWVKTEIRNARKLEVAEKKRVLFPVRLASYAALRDWRLFDADEGEDLATEIREYYIPDFSEWKNHDPYSRELEKLLRDLRKDASKSA
jgi:uncharacterized protein YjbI with pentapeptide repeats